MKQDPPPPPSVPISQNAVFLKVPGSYGGLHKHTEAKSYDAVGFVNASRQNLYVVCTLKANSDSILHLDENIWPISENSPH